ncbi:MAG: PAS domain-containing protein [Nitrospirota bacterium]|nr:PAS domain-containing protein [Nitrospirota bacterium]MDE3224771.1 PAS domain-containing protein [Nitrospirota bacterium]MDE3243423.1 PAS domain-containing protein [Nitrospirota bacterium]
MSNSRPAAERFYGRQFVRKIPSTYYEYPLIRKDGSEIWIGQNVQVLLEDGQVVGFQAVARDITERKQAEEGLKEQMRLSMLAAEVNGALVQRAPLHAMLQSCAEALVRHLDAVFARIWLLGPGDLCGDCHKASHCADRTQCLHLEASAGLYRNLNGEYRRIPLGALKIGKIAQGHGPMVTNDALNDERLQNKDWTQQHGLRSFAGYPLLLESQVMGVMAIFARHPLTGPAVSAMETVSKALSLGIERKKAEEALQESEQRLELALRGGDLGTWDWQVQTGAAVFNRRWAEMLGYALEELAPHIGTWERLVHSEDLPQVMDALQAHLNGHTSAFESELRMKTKGGGWRWILARGRVVSRDAQGRPVRATGTHLDITDRKRAEADVKERSRQLEAANKELEAFSYSVSHDLRAPLRHIDGFAELLEQQAAPVLDEKGRKYLRAISDSAQRMGRLIDDLLEFSRTGRAELHARVVPLEALVRNVLDDLQPETEGRTIDWTIGPLPKVQGDPALLRQVWFNLVANAIKYTRPRDRATIEIGRAPSTGDHEVVVFVRDNGVGFDMQYVGKLFGVFQRLHGIDDFEGSGIGLANVQRIVARHGGRVWAEGAVGRGATFYVALPLLEGDGR